MFQYYLRGRVHHTVWYLQSMVSRGLFDAPGLSPPPADGTTVAYLSAIKMNKVLHLLTVLEIHIIEKIMVAPNIICTGVASHSNHLN